MEGNDTGDSTSPVGRSFGPAELSALVSGAPFLEGLAPEVVAHVAAACELVQIAGDRQLLRREQPNDSLYVVVHGGLRTMARDVLGREYVVAESYRGDSVGMLGLLPRVTAPVDVFAIRDSVLLRLTRASFTALGARFPELLMRLAEGVARRAVKLLDQREWSNWRHPGAVAQNIALLVPSRDHQFARAAADLARTTLGRFRRVGWITRESLDQAIGPGASASNAGNENVLAFLQGLEATSDIVLYECDTTAPAWTERCLRQADRVLAIMRADRSDHFQEIRALLEPTLAQKQTPHIELALVHSEGADVPSRSVEGWSWLTQNAVLHHLRMGSAADYERLARTLLRSGIALVLSGGGARGIAHVGVLKALEEAGVPVDAIAGTSMGSIFAAGYARGWNADALMVRVRELFSSRTALYDPTLPFQALLAGRKLERVVRSYFGGLDIETLWLPFFCVSTSLSRAEPRVHDSGELWRAVVASCSIPGVFPPRQEGDDYLVDGGVVDNLPVDVMATRFDGTILASDVGGEGETAPAHASPRSSGWRNRLRHALHLPADGAPRILETLTRTSTIGSRRVILASLARGEAALHVKVPLGRFGMLDWSAHDDIYAAGYESAVRQLATWVPPWGRGAGGVSAKKENDDGARP